MNSLLISNLLLQIILGLPHRRTTSTSERFLEIEELASWFDQLEPEPVGFIEDIYEPYLPKDHNESEHWDDWNETDPIFDHNYSDEYDPIDDFEDWNDLDLDHDDNFSDTIEDGHPVFEFNSLDLLELTGIDHWD